MKTNKTYTPTEFWGPKIGKEIDQLGVELYIIYRQEIRELTTPFLIPCLTYKLLKR